MKVLAVVFKEAGAAGQPTSCQHQTARASPEQPSSVLSHLGRVCCSEQFGAVSPGETGSVGLLQDNRSALSGFFIGRDSGELIKMGCVTLVGATKMGAI